MTGPLDTSQRRALIATLPNPGLHHDCLVTLAAAPAENLSLELHYIPDRSVVTAEAWDRYVAALDPALPPEALAVTVLDDVNNEVVPRWVQVAVERTGAAPRRHRAVIEDAQPGWTDASGVLARLPA